MAALVFLCLVVQRNCEVGELAFFFYLLGLVTFVKSVTLLFYSLLLVLKKHLLSIRLKVLEKPRNLYSQLNTIYALFIRFMPFLVRVDTELWQH